MVKLSEFPQRFVSLLGSVIEPITRRDQHGHKINDAIRIVDLREFLRLMSKDPSKPMTLGTFQKQMNNHGFKKTKTGGTEFYNIEWRWDVPGSAPRLLRSSRKAGLAPLINAPQSAAVSYTRKHGLNQKTVPQMQQQQQTNSMAGSSVYRIAALPAEMYPGRNNSPAVEGSTGSSSHRRALEAKGKMAAAAAGSHSEENTYFCAERIDDDEEDENSQDETENDEDDSNLHNNDNGTPSSNNNNKHRFDQSNRDGGRSRIAARAASSASSVAGPFAQNHTVLQRHQNPPSAPALLFGRTPSFQNTAVAQAARTRNSGAIVPPTIMDHQQQHHNHNHAVASGADLDEISTDDELNDADFVSQTFGGIDDPNTPSLYPLSHEKAARELGESIVNYDQAAVQLPSMSLFTPNMSELTHQIDVTPMSTRLSYKDLNSASWDDDFLSWPEPSKCLSISSSSGSGSGSSSTATGTSLLIPKYSAAAAAFATQR